MPVPIQPTQPKRVIICVEQIVQLGAVSPPPDVGVLLANTNPLSLDGTSGLRFRFLFCLLASLIPRWSWAHSKSEKKHPELRSFDEWSTAIELTGIDDPLSGLYKVQVTTTSP